MKYIISAYTDEGFYGYVCLIADPRNKSHDNSYFEFTDEKQEATRFDFDDAYHNLDVLREMFEDYQFVITNVE